MTGLTNFILHVGSVAGFFAIFDSLATREQREIVSSYIFGSREVTFLHFEYTLISSILNVFLREDGTLSLRRILPYSMAVCLLSFLFLLIVFNPEDSLSEESHWIVPSILFGVLLSPLDYLSFRITKALFIDRLFDLNLPTRFVIDFSFSSAPAILLFFVCKTAVENHRHELGETLGALVVIIGFGAVISVVLVGIVQVLSILTGATMRFLTESLNLFGFIERHSNILNVPFLFIGFLFGLVTFFFA